MRIVIVGGGFAGVKCARELRKQLSPAQYEIVLFNRENHMVFHPLLAEVVSATVQAKDVGAPLRQLLKNVHCRTEEIVGVDLEKNEIAYIGHDGQKRTMSYYQLVLTCGNTVNLSIVPGMDEHAFPLKTIGDAFALQSHIMEQLEKAEVCDDVERKRWYLNFIVVGGGFSGVEVAGEINDLVRGSLKFFSNIAPQDICVQVVHSQGQILPEVNQSLRDFAQKKMEKCGVKFRLNSMASAATSEGLGLKDGTLVSGATIICTIGTTILPLIDRMSGEKSRGRLVVEPDMSLPGQTNVWAFGDCAAVVNSDGSTCPPVAQFAERQGAQCAHNIIARIKGEPTKPFHFKMLGQMCSIGGRSAVAEMFGMRVSGIVAWIIWRGVYLFKLPSLSQVLKVGLEWACDLVFPRTLAHIKADRTRRVCGAHYPAGTIIFRQGDPALDFYVIQKGEVEMINMRDGEVSELVAILGQGDFFGEHALLNDRPRSLTARARTEVQTVVLGRNVFTQISSALAPVRDAVAKAARRRTNIWQNLPEVKQLLNEASLESLLEPLPCEPLPVTSTVELAVEKMNDQQLDFLVIVDDDGILKGIVTRSDLLRAVELAALADPDVDLPLVEIMASDPIALTVDEPLTTAVATMREHGLKRLPVVQSSDRRQIVGYLRIEKVMHHMVKEMIARKKHATARL